MSAICTVAYPTVLPAPWISNVWPAVAAPAQPAVPDTMAIDARSGEIALANTRTELLGVITTILEAGRAGDLRAGITAEDIAASLIGILTVVGKPEQHARANRLLDLLVDGLGPRLPSA